MRAIRHLAVLLLVFCLCTPAWAAVDIGQKAPALIGTRLDGGKDDLVAMKGKVVIVNFWATWCVPCRAELPELSAFYRDYHGKGVELVAVSVDRLRNIEDVREVSKMYKIPATMLDDVSKNDFGLPPFIPITYIVDRDGVVQSILRPDVRMMTYQVLEQTIKPLLESKTGGDKPATASAGEAK